MNDKSQVESILNDIRLMVNNVIVKLSYQADQYETAEIRREADKYITAYMEKDNLAVSKNNILKIKFDAYFSSEKENMRVELRDLNGGYPQ